VNNRTLCDVFPHLYSYSLDEDISVHAYTNSDELQSVFALPLLVEAFEELQRLNEITSEVNLDPVVVDSRHFTWGNDTYTSAQFYKFAFSIIYLKNLRYVQFGSLRRCQNSRFLIGCFS
jgi:hypothetical protein